MAADADKEVLSVCASRSLCELGNCADLLSPPALLCHVAVCVWVSMFAIWMDFLRLFVYLFIPTRAKKPTVSVRVVWYWIFTRL